MKQLTAVIALILTACGPGQLLGPTPTPDPCSPDLLAPVLKDFDSVVNRFVDANELAGNTPRSDLPTQIAELQAIRRDAEAISAPYCLTSAKVYLVRSMDAAIDGYILFLDADNPQSAVNAKFDKAVEAIKDYRAEIESLSGRLTVTPEP